jgi:hypothetical protein
MKINPECCRIAIADQAWDIFKHGRLHCISSGDGDGSLC